MAKRSEDPNVTDLRRYRRQREKAAHRPKPKSAPGGGFLGSNPRAGLILALVLLALLAVYVLPRFL